MASRVNQAGAAFLVTTPSPVRVDQSGAAFLTTWRAPVRVNQAGVAFLVRNVKISAYLKIDPPIKTPKPRMEVPPVLD